MATSWVRTHVKQQQPFSSPMIADGELRGETKDIKISGLLGKVYIAKLNAYKDDDVEALSLDSDIRNQVMKGRVVFSSRAKSKSYTVCCS